MATRALLLPEPRNARVSFFISGSRNGVVKCRPLLVRRELKFAAAAHSSSSSAAVAGGAEVEKVAEVKRDSLLTFQKAIQRLQVGAGTMNLLTFLRVLGPDLWNVAYVQPSIRPDYSQYGENTYRLQRHTQFQLV